ncbi:MAG TPA: hypothetical protein VK724_14790 [Bryobacteraceae bacterium]|jgi:hypothetical protein|nr:hypothetical protein [Bryobacteraceae bacterium]
MQRTTQETLSKLTIAGSRDAARPGLRAGVTYGFLILALCLMITDFCRLI